jgi:Zn-dependent protease with chaperone function
MKKLPLSSVLLIALVIPFVMTYRLSSGETPYLLFGIIFLSLLFYLLLDFVSWKLRPQIKTGLLASIIVLVIGSAVLAVITVRHRTAPIYGVHDIILQL